VLSLPGRRVWQQCHDSTIAIFAKKVKIAVGVEQTVAHYRGGGRRM